MLEILISSSVLILVIAVLRLVLHDKISARLQYALWIPVLIRLLVPVSISHSPVSIAEIASPVTTQVQDFSASVHIDDLPDYILDTEDREQTDPVAYSHTLTMGEAARGLWFIGMAVMAVWLLFINVKLAQRLKKSRVQFRCNAALPVYVTEGIPSPCLFGLFKPAIYLTERAAEDKEQSQQIITHEMTHFRHGDMIWALLRSVCLVIWWFDPFVWLAAILSRRDCELACDEGTIRTLGEEARFDYGRTLVDMAKVGPRPSDLLCGATTMTSGRRTLLERVERIAKAPRASLALAALALLIAALTVGCTYTGSSRETESTPARGADVFKIYYSQRAESDTAHDYSRMDLDILDEMASGTAGTAVDTEELTIEVAGAVVSGNTAEIILRVTANELDSVLREGDSLPSPNYRFGDETALLGIFTLNRNFYSLSHSYIYPDAKETLASNQFELHYRIITPEPFRSGSYAIPYWVDVAESSDSKPFIIPLSDFGYYEQGRFVPLYEGDSENEGDWNVEVALDPVSDPGKHVGVDREITVGGFRFSMKDIRLTPLACTIRLECLEDESVISEHNNEVFSALYEDPSKAALVLSDGTPLTDDCFEFSGSGDGRNYYVTLSFYGPISVDGIVSLSLFGQKFSFD